MSDQVKNVDQICAKYSLKIAEEFEQNPKEGQSLITKALAVLQQQGLYAFGLFCKTETKAYSILQKALELFKDENLKFIHNSELDDLSQLIELSKELDDLIFAIEVLEKTLIYARYHAKAMVKGSGS